MIASQGREKREETRRRRSRASCSQRLASRVSWKARGRRGRKHVGYEVFCVTPRPGIVRWHGLGYFVCREENPFLRHWRVHFSTVCLGDCTRPPPPPPPPLPSWPTLPFLKASFHGLRLQVLRSGITMDFHAILLSPGVQTPTLVRSTFYSFRSRESYLEIFWHCFRE